MSWSKCNSCGKVINYSSIYHKCSVSSCRKFSFCTVDCWSLHSEMQNHKSSYAEEEKAPSSAQENREPRRILVKAKNNSSNSVQSTGVAEREVVIVASKLKNYVKDKHGMNTSGNVMEALSDIVRYHVDQAVDKARSEGRKTLMDRDF